MRMIHSAIRKYSKYFPDRSTYPIIWREKERLGDDVMEAFVCILKTKGCFWDRCGGCTMCGYNKKVMSDLPGLDAQFNVISREYHGEKIVKIYTSGSFFDPDEIPVETSKKVLTHFRPAKKIVVETRPEFVSEARIADISRVVPQLEVAFGLESSSEETLSMCINKGMKVEDYVRGAEIVRSNSLTLRTYILLKPPFLSEWRGVCDALESIRFASKYSDIISLNPVTVQSGTLVEHLYRRKEYRPPWLWSVEYVLKGYTGKDLICSTTGFGSPAGPHNCGRCSDAFRPLIERFNLTGEYNGEIRCDCRRTWERELAEGRLLGGLPISSF
jgi:radical SAM enzyme (TIGR01210 family)